MILMLLTEISDETDHPLVWGILAGLLKRKQTVLVSDNLFYKVTERLVTFIKFDASVADARKYNIHSEVPEGLFHKFGRSGPTLVISYEELDGAKLKKVGDHYELDIEVDNEGN
jgi:hypothetical protein